MSRLPPSLRSTRLYPLWVAIAAAVVLFVGLGRYGLWEPNEVRVANRANDIANPEAGETQAEASPNNPAKKPRKKPPRRQVRSELSENLIAAAIARTGRSEGSSRAPLALLALITVLATFFIGLRVGGPRAGLFAAIILLTFPALLMHGRHLTSEIGSAAGSALAALGLIGLLARRGFGFRKDNDYPIAYVPIDLALVAGGLLLSYKAAGAMLGAMPPAVGIGAAGLIGLLSDKRPRDGEGVMAARAHMAAAGAIGLSVAIGFFAYFVFKVFDLIDPAEIENAKVAAKTEGWAILGGRTLKPETEYVDALAGVWRSHPDLRIGFSSTLEGMAFGAFPWIAAVPIAGTLLLIGRPGKARSPNPARAALVLWALAAYAAGAVFTRKVGVSMYPAWGALAAICGVWLADIFKDGRGSRGQLPLVALFVFAAAIVVGKDILAFPEKLASLNLTGPTLDWPKGVKLQFLWVVVCWASILALVLALAFRDRRSQARATGGNRWLAKARKVSDTAADIGGRGGLIAAMVLSLCASLLFSQGLTPALSAKLSAKNILGVYNDLRVDGDALGIMGNAGGASYYAGTEWEKIRGRKQLLEFLSRPTRVFALAPASERCPLNKEARKKSMPYYVVDDSSAQFLLYSNQLKPGEADRNPLIGTFFADRPTDIRKPLSFTLDGRLELVGVSMPDTVRKGSKFKMKLYFRVIKPVSRNWKIFVHFDRGVRFQADHDPIDGTCGTAYWLPGDYVVDEFEVSAGSRTHPRGQYNVYVGLFVGSAGNWTNMKVTSEGADKDNRIPIGTIQVR